MEEWTLIPRSNNNWITFVLGFNFLLFVFTKWRFQQAFFAFFRLIDNSTQINNYSGKGILKQGFILCLTFFSLSNISLLATYIMGHYQLVAIDFSTFRLILSSTLLIVAIRHILQLFLAYILDLEEFLHQFQFRNNTYIFRLSTLLFVGLVLYQYTHQLPDLFFNGFLVLILFIYLLTQLLLVRDFFSTINRGGLYFILYLCTLKLSPWILLIGGLKN